MQEQRSVMSLELANEDSNDTKAIIAGVIFGILIVLILFLPYFGFEKMDPPLEAEGVMADFGNVQYAGGDDPNPTPQPQPTPQPTPPVKDDVETVKDDDSPSIPDVKDDPTPTPNPDPTPPKPAPDPAPSPIDGSLFGGGNGSNVGGGDQGNQFGGKFGKGDGRGLGDKGNGLSDMGDGRARKSDCTLTKEYQGSDRGVVWVEIRVEADGRVSAAQWVTKARRNTERTTITSQKLRGMAEKCALQYVYASANTAQRGYVKIEFKPQ
ncbi:MAG: hypothetical protein MK212_03265 [Saprospiraceae bacterium]|nr:hypothetical protein [Saprospiraceae bacterium]